jgi:hypothetical protein
MARMGFLLYFTKQRCSIGQMLPKILDALTRYSANAPNFPVNNSYRCFLGERRLDGALRRNEFEIQAAAARAIWAIFTRDKMLRLV